MPPSLALHDAASRFVRRDHPGTFTDTDAGVQLRSSGTLYVAREMLNDRRKVVSGYEEVALDRKDQDVFLVREKPMSMQAAHVRIAVIDALRANGYEGVAHGQTVSRQSARSAGSVPTYVLFVRPENFQ